VPWDWDFTPTTGGKGTAAREEEDDRNAMETGQPVEENGSVHRGEVSGGVTGDVTGATHPVLKDRKAHHPRPHHSEQFKKHIRQSAEKLMSRDLTEEEYEKFEGGATILFVVVLMGIMYKIGGGGDEKQADKRI
jgi:hypothetical protein